MSKPDASGAKSLEEILASIRKSLSGEGGDTASGARGAARTPVPTTPRPEPPADTAGDGDGDGLLSARLAGALNGPSNGAALDDDFMELLAPDDRKPAPPEPAGAAKPADARSEGKDPLWFLRQPSGAAQSNGAQAPAAHTQPAEGPLPLAPAKASPPAPEEEVKLSRPEVLRASLPPLFGGEDRHSTAARTSPPDVPKAPPSVAPAVHARTASPTPIGSVAPGNPLTARTQLPQPVAESAKAIAPAESPSAPAAEEPTLLRDAAPAAEAEAGPRPPVEAKPANGLLNEPHAEAAAKPAAAPVREGPAARPAPAAEATQPQARTLEQVIGELLEPVIRQWLDTNLPRLVEAAVREEVARAIAAEPRTPKV